MSLSVLAKRCVELSYRHKLSHVSSVLNTVDLLAEIYEKRHKYEPVILANGHAGLALYVCLEHHGLCDAEKMIGKHGVHPSRDMASGIWVSSGSLGLGETLAVGFALADKSRKVWLVTSDGSCMEGSVYEAFRVASQHCPNLEVHIVFNGTGAYGDISAWDLPTSRPASTKVHLMGDQLPIWLQGIAGHYLILDDQQFAELMS